MHESLFALERELLTTGTRRDRDRLEELLAPDFFEFGSSGNVWSRSEILSRLPTETATQVVASDFRSQEISTGVVLVTYQTIRIESDGSPFKALRSSIWKLNGSVWQMRFHQGTKAAT